MLFSCLLVFEFHEIIVFSKEIQVEFQLIKCELDHLIREAHNLLENVERLPGDDRDTELQGKLTRLSCQLNEYAKQARTRETLSSALVSEEEQIRTKLAAMEQEQVCHQCCLNVCDVLQGYCKCRSIVVIGFLICG